MLKTYQGSCHCGKVRFEADLDLSTGTGKCNCSICTKQRNWGMSIKPDAFRLLSGQDDLGDYTFGSHSVHHMFCKHCRIRTFSRGYVEEMGGAFYSIALAALDNATPEELVTAPVRYFDGRSNHWEREPEETRHL